MPVDGYLVPPLLIEHEFVLFTKILIEGIVQTTILSPGRSDHGTADGQKRLAPVRCGGTEYGDDLHIMRS